MQFKASSRDGMSDIMRGVGWETVQLDRFCYVQYGSDQAIGDITTHSRKAEHGHPPFLIRYLLLYGG